MTALPARARERVLEHPFPRTEVALDRPEVVAAVRAAFDRYERALVAGDVAVLTELFWADPRCVRFGVTDRQQGGAEIAAWRAAHPSVPPGRRLWDTRVVAVDEHTAVVTTLFDYPDRAVEGRQSQTWVRFAEGWRIVAAHVAELPQVTVLRSPCRRRGGAPHRPAAELRTRRARCAVRRGGGHRADVSARRAAGPGGAARGPRRRRHGWARDRGGAARAADGRARRTPRQRCPPRWRSAASSCPRVRCWAWCAANAPAEAVDVSAWGSWPAYLAAVEAGAASG